MIGPVVSGLPVLSPVLLVGQALDLVEAHPAWQAAKPTVRSEI